jgi:hypothetical protein
MRKTAILSAVIILFSVTACEQKPPELPVSKPETFSIQFEVPSDSDSEKTTETALITLAETAPVTTTASAAPLSEPEIKTTADYIDIMEKEMDDRTEQLFLALVGGDKETLGFLGTGRSENGKVYDFIDDITFGDYEIKPLKAYYQDRGGIEKKDYSITLEVIKSSDERFPEGVHTYKITALPAVEGAFFTQLIRDGEPEKQAIINSFNGGGLISVNAYTCYDLTLEMLPFYGRESTDKFELPKENTAEFYSGLSRFFSHIKVAENGENAQNYNAAAKSYFGIDTAFDENNVSPLWYGANSLEAVLVSENENSVVIDYYADSLLLVKAYSVKYNFDTADGFRFTSIENLYDSGLEAARHTT